MNVRSIKRVCSAAAVAIVLLAASASASASGAFRCGNRLVSPGDHVTKLLEFCGEPVNVQTRYAQRALIGNSGRIYPNYVEEVRIEEWTYNLGPYQLMRSVRLENDIVTEIRSGLGYGY